jgi:hypothetical protein
MAASPRSSWGSTPGSRTPRWRTKQTSPTVDVRQHRAPCCWAMGRWAGVGTNEVTIYLWLIILSVWVDIFIDSEVFLMIDFVNLKIKTAQSFEGVLRGRVCVRVFIGVSNHTYMNICVCTVFLKKELKQMKCSKNYIYYNLVLNWLQSFK